MAEQQAPQRNVAVVGAFSFLGRRLLGELATDTRYGKVVAFDVRTPPAGTNGVHHFQVDLTQPQAGAKLAEVMRSCAIDTVVQLAYLSRPVHQQTWAHELETLGTMQVLGAATAVGIRHVIAVSTTMCYGARPDNPALLDEDHALRGSPMSRWVSDKVDAERQLAELAAAHPHMTVTVLRMAALVGPHADNFWCQLLRRRTVPVVMGHDPLMQFLHEDDASRALKRAVDATPRGAFNIAPLDVISLQRAVARLGRLPLPLPGPLARPLLGALWSAQVARIPAPFLDYLQHDWVVDPQRARQQLGFTPRHTSTAAIDALGAAQLQTTAHTAPANAAAA